MYLFLVLTEKRGLYYDAGHAWSVFSVPVLGKTIQRHVFCLILL